MSGHVVIQKLSFRAQFSPIHGTIRPNAESPLFESPGLRLTLLVSLILCCLACTRGQDMLTDSIAEKMLLFQRNNGGWPQYKGDPTNYKLPIDDSRREILRADKDRLDATMDDRSTTGEIKYLLKAYGPTHNTTYLDAADHGIKYLLDAQNDAGGWPQSYPNLSSYHSHITYNDNAMIDVLRIMKDLAEGRPGYEPVPDSLRVRADEAWRRGVTCILNTQIIQHGKLTVWCAQHDSKTLQPAQARTFEPPSLSGMESVGIVRFLMSIDDPSAEIRQAIEAAVQWFEQVKIEGYNVEIRRDTTQVRGYDRVIFKDDDSTIWARFYELETFRPIFSGRDGQIKYALDQVENERRVGYAFYGKWPQELITRDYPEWLNKRGRE